MKLERVKSYAVIEQDIPSPLLKMLGSTPYSVRLDLDGDREFSMSTIPGYIAEALKQTDADETGDIFHALRKMIGSGIGLDKAKRMSINIDYDNSECLFNNDITENNTRIYEGRNAEVISCRARCEDNFSESSESILTADNLKVEIKNPMHAVYAAGVFNCDLEINGRFVRDFKYFKTDCGSQGECFSLALDLDGDERTPILVGFEPEEALFLEGYCYKNRVHALDFISIENCKENVRVDASGFIYLAIRNGLELRSIEINSAYRNNYCLIYVAEAITDKKRIRMIPSSAFLLSRIFGVDAFVEDGFVRMQEEH